MKQVKLITMLFALLMGLSSQAAKAVFIDQGDSVLDTNSGLEWLKLTATDAMSANTAAATFAGDGWLIATETQYEAMFDGFFTGYVQNYAGGYMQAGAGTDQYNQANDFRALFGQTYAYESSIVAYAAYAFYMGNDSILRLGGTYTSVSGGNANLHRDNTGNQNTYLTTAHLNAGVFMVRMAPVIEPVPAPVPEATSLLLLGLGLLGLAFIRRKMK